VAEATGLRAITVNFNRSLIDGALHKIGQNHAIAARLARANGVEEARHNDRLFFLFPVGESEKFVEGLGGGIAPTPLGGRAKNEVGVLMERHLGVLAVDLGGRGNQKELLFLAGSFEDELRAVDIGFDGTDGAFHNEFHADSSSQVNDDVGIIDKFGEELAVLDAVEVVLQVVGTLEVPDILHAAGGKIVQQHDAFALLEQPFRQVRPDKTSAAGNEIAHAASLEFLRIVEVRRMDRSACGGLFAERIQGLLGTIAVRIGVIPIRIVVIRGAGVDGVEHYSQQMALDAGEQVACARKGFLGSLATANNEE